MTRAIMLAILLASACVVTVLGVGACRRDDPTAKQIQVTLSSAKAATPVGTRGQLLRQVYRDRDYRSCMWMSEDIRRGGASKAT